MVHHGKHLVSPQHLPVSGYLPALLYSVTYIVIVFTWLIESHLARLLRLKIMHCSKCFIKQRGSDKAAGCLLLSACKLISRKSSMCLIHAEIPVNQQGIFKTHREMMDSAWRIAALVCSWCILNYTLFLGIHFKKLRFVWLLAKKVPSF